MKRIISWTVSVAILGALASNSVIAQVVADSACPKYAVDIAYFATCDGDRVARDETQEPRLATEVASQTGRDVGNGAPAAAARSANSKSPANQPRKKRTISNADQVPL